jgi:methyltransferase
LISVKEVAVTNLGATIAILSFVTAQRLVELVYARRNEARLRARGAVEYAAEHYWLIVALHAVWLAGLWLMSAGRSIDPVWLAIFFVLQALRIWVLTTLKDRWTTRIIVLPGAPLITDGPYRFMRHPNYAIVTAEIMVLPMVFGLYAYGIAFTLANAGILAIRIRAETRALQGASAQPPNLGQGA